MTAFLNAGGGGTFPAGLRIRGRAATCKAFHAACGLAFPLHSSAPTERQGRCIEKPRLQIPPRRRITTNPIPPRGSRTVKTTSATLAALLSLHALTGAAAQDT